MTNTPKKSKVHKILSVNPYNWPSGLIYYFTLNMENWDTWSIGKKNQEAIKEWQELEYTTEIKNGKNVFVEYKPNNFSKSWSYQRDHNKDAVWFAMAYAKDLVVAGKCDISQITDTAEKLYAWMMAKLQS